MATTAKNNYSPTFQKYLDDSFYPAQRWALSKDGAALIAKHAPSLKTLIDKFYDDALFACYSVSLNGRPLYVGQSVRSVRRMCVHMFNLVNAPDSFGLKAADLDEVNCISFQILETGIYDESLRKKTELYYIKSLKPLLQKCDGTDSCIPRSKRRAAVQPYIKSAPTGM